MLERNTEPRLVALSLTAYRLLLAFYPTHFRREYGSHMAQVFRDNCRRSYRQSGPPGMLALWALTLFDWFKSVIEEQLNRETNMIRAKWIRSSGWGLMVGPFALFAGLGDPVQYRSLLDNLFGMPADHRRLNAYRFVSETVPTFLILVGLSLILFGFWGLSSHYRQKVGRFGRLCLRLLVINAGVTAAGGVLSLTGTEMWWITFILGFFATYILLGAFGIAALKDRPLPRWNTLPLVTGIIFSGIVVIGLISGWDENPNFLSITMAFSLLGSVLIGYVLQSEAAQTVIS
jgi:hypothetical protein